MSTLYVVGTPIGNLKDITERALETLKSVDLILCEDTRVTRKLLSHFDIHTPAESFFAPKERVKTNKALQALKEGKNVALVSDAGTPTISDPGSFLISEIHQKHKDNISVVAIPGPSALTAALSVSGMPASDFLFLGFLPHKKGREKLFTEISESKRTVVFYESPHRILKTLMSLEEILDTNRKIALVRELTKIHEETFFGTTTDALSYLETHPDKVKGEFVVVVEGR